MNNRLISIVVALVMVLSLVAMAALVLVYGWMPEQKSSTASVIDAPFYFVVAVSTVLMVGVVATMILFMFKFGRRHEDQTAELVYGSAAVEAAWIVIPTILVLVVFTWGFKAFMTITQPPKNAYEIHATARKWSWDFEYPNGFVSTNELYVPSNRPVKMIMTSTDVLHSFFVPAFRVKHDVIPNRYSTVWFTATEETGMPVEGEDPTGYIQIYCTEYCGTGHSNMMARLWVLPQDDYDSWLAAAGSGGEDLPLPELGEQVFGAKACLGCHSVDGSGGVGPSMKGLFGTSETMSDGSTVEVDENYLRESIIVPAAKVVQGYQPIMPPIPMSDREVEGLIEFIKTLE